jgi:hypothetical protein
VFLVWNATGTFFSILNIFIMPRNLIHIWECLLCFHIFPLTALALPSGSGAESYGSLKLDGS